MKRYAIVGAVGVALVLASGCSGNRVAGAHTQRRRLAPWRSASLRSLPTAQAQPARVEPLKVEPEKSSDDWEFEITPYLWMLALDSRLTLRNRTVDADASFSDIVDHLNYGGAGRIEVHKGKYGLFFDGLYLDLEGDAQRRIIRAEGTARLGVADFGGMYRLWELERKGSAQPWTSFELLGGGRYTYVKGRIRLSPGPDLDRSGDWIEPLVGGRIKVGITERLSLAVRGDASGFAVGSGSDLTWNLVGGLDYRLTKHLSLKGGYRIYDLDYSRGHGTRKFAWNARVQGPVVGLTFRF